MEYAAMTPSKHPVKLNKTLLDEARTLNATAERCIFELGLILVKIAQDESYKLECENFYDWCMEELGRSRGFISKLLTASQFVLQNGFREETKQLSVSKLHAAISAFPNKKPSQILAASKTLTLKELEQESRETKNGVCTEHQWITICTKCHQRK